MDICAVKTLIEFVANGNLTYFPHEPKSEHRFQLKMVLEPGSLGDYAECKHCNCIYAAGTEDVSG